MTVKPSRPNPFLNLGDCQLSYWQGGLDRPGTPILFLHGWGISTEPYQTVLNRLAQHHPVFAPDLPSFGNSTYPKRLPDYDSYAQFLLAFLNALQLQQVHLMGHSFGGGLSITLAALAPERVKSLVLIGSTGVPQVSLLEIVPRRAIEMVAQLFLPELHLKLIDIPAVFTHNLLFNTGNVIQALLLSLQVDLSHLLPHLQAPALLIWSNKDLTTPVDAARTMATLMPRARLEIVEEGFHEWGLWYPDKLTAMTLEFLHQVDASVEIERL